jgi:hypothetical protein
MGFILQTGHFNVLELSAHPVIEMAIKTTAIGTVFSDSNILLLGRNVSDPTPQLLAV